MASSLSCVVARAPRASRPSVSRGVRRSVSVSNAATASDCALLFSVHAPIDFGHVLAVVGDAEQLGAWEPESALKLEWHEGDQWEGTVHSCTIRDDGSFYKLIVLDSDDAVVCWEDGANRFLALPPIESGVPCAFSKVSLEWDDCACDHVTHWASPDHADAVETGASIAALMATETLSTATLAAETPTETLAETPAALSTETADTSVRDADLARSAEMSRSSTETAQLATLLGEQAAVAVAVEHVVTEKASDVPDAVTIDAQVATGEGGYESDDDDHKSAQKRTLKSAVSTFVDMDEDEHYDSDEAEMSLEALKARLPWHHRPE